jgi:hypothetical protein
MEEDRGKGIPDETAEVESESLEAEGGNVEAM